MSAEEGKVLEHISQDPTHIDELTRRCELPVAQVSSALTMLELKGVVRQVASMTYVRK
jgi:DNA processing protein